MIYNGLFLPTILLICRSDNREFLVFCSSVMEQSSNYFCLEEHVSLCCSRSWFHFLQNPEGVGAITNRLIELDKSWCPFCSGLGTCLGPNCLGSKPANKLMVRKPVKLSSVSRTGIPGLAQPSKKDNLVLFSDNK